METPPTASHFWDREVVAPVHSSWMEDPRIRDYILRSISGSEEGVWPMDWLQSRLPGRRFERALSIGCGSGALERDLIRRNLAGVVDAFDGSTNSLRLAREEAAKLGMTERIRYFAADFNNPALPRRHYDIVFIHQALHHVSGLETLMPAVMRALTRSGLLYLDEYVGPSRTDWNGKLIEPHRAVYDALPAELRRESVLKEPVMEDDPSEAIRSSEIMNQLRTGFDLLDVRGYGGNLLSVLYTSMRLENLDDATVHRLIAEEKQLLSAGAQPYYVVMLARPKRGVRGLRALYRYFKPELRRMREEFRRRWF